MLGDITVPKHIKLKSCKVCGKKPMPGFCWGGEPGPFFFVCKGTVYCTRTELYDTMEEAAKEWNGN